MPDDITPILAKVKKLLALATSSNLHEAELATTKAQSLLMQYNLTLVQVQTHDQPSSYERSTVETGSRIWKRRLLGSLALTNFCISLYSSRQSNCILVGQPHDLEVVIYLYNYLASQLESMALAAYHQSGTTVHAKTWMDAFYVGAVRSIYERLEAQKQDMVDHSDQCRSLVVVKDAQLNEAVRKFYPKTGEGYSPRKRIKSSTGYNEGREAGNHIALNKAVKSNTASTKLIGS